MDCNCWFCRDHDTATRWIKWTNRLSVAVIVSSLAFLGRLLWEGIR